MERRVALLNELVPELRRCETALADLSGCIQRILSESSEQSVAPIRSFPPEIWHEIFTYLRPPDLNTVRLACRAFNDIVSSSTRLMERYPIYITQKTIDSHHDRIHALGTTSSRFRNVVLENIQIVNPGVCYWLLSIWENVGGSIRFLNIADSDVPTDVIFRILACMPELRTFYLYPAVATSSDVFEQSNMNLVLHNLRDFTMWVRNVAQMPLLRKIQEICPNLKKLDLTAKIDNNELIAQYEEAVLGFVTTIRSIEQINFNATHRLLMRMSEVSELRFRELTLDEHVADEITEQNIVSLVRNTPTVETLNLSNIDIKDFATLIEIGKSLPNLTWISLVVCSSTPMSEDFSFLLHMPKLEHFRLRQQSATLLWFNVNRSGNPKLAQLCLERVYLPRNVLLDYLRRSPGIDSVDLFRCTFEYASDVIVLITQLKSLTTVNLCETSFTIRDNVDVLQIDGFSNVRNVELSASLFSYSLVLQIVNRCPDVVKLRLAGFINNEVLREVCQSMKLLKALELYKCLITVSGYRCLLACHGKSLTLESLYVVLKPSQESDMDAVRELLGQLKDVSVHIVCGELCVCCSR